jgi:hypothetical protein
LSFSYGLSADCPGYDRPAPQLPAALGYRRAKRSLISAVRGNGCYGVFRSFRTWQLVPFHFTLVQNIKRDPFEQAGGIDQKTAMSLGGALGTPATAFLYDWNMLPIGQQLWLKELESYQTYPPLQAPESYNLSQIIEQVKRAELSRPQD